MIIPASVIQAEDKIIDGIRFRFSYVTNTSALRVEDYHISAYDKHFNTEYIGTFAGKQKFPVAIIFPETLMASWSFRQAFFDFSFSEELKNVPPVPDQSISSQLDSAWNKGSDLIYLR